MGGVDVVVIVVVFSGGALMISPSIVRKRCGASEFRIYNHRAS
jgi:hypothetical protein